MMRGISGRSSLNAFPGCPKASHNRRFLDLGGHDAFLALVPAASGITALIAIRPLRNYRPGRGDANLSASLLLNAPGVFRCGGSQILGPKVIDSGENKSRRNSRYWKNSPKIVKPVALNDGLRLCSPVKENSVQRELCLST
jgi:hypothetical protein